MSLSSELLRARLGLFPPKGLRLVVTDVVDEVFESRPDPKAGVWRKVRVPHRKVTMTLFDDHPKPIRLRDGGQLNRPDPEVVGLWIAGRTGVGETSSSAVRATLAAWRAAGAPISGVLTVVKAALGEELRHKGFGTAAYLRLAQLAATQGDAIQAHAAETGTSMTSEDALRVWSSLEKLGVGSGLVAWAGPEGT